MDAAVGEHLHDLGIQHVLNRVDVLLERVDIPALLNSQRTLGDDGTVVVDLVGKMHGHASYLDAARKGIVNRMRAGKARQQRRMQVDHAVGKRRQQRRVHHAHVAGHDHILAAAFEKLVRDDLVGGDGVGVDILGQRERLDARALGTLQALGRRTARHHKLNRSVELAGGDQIDQRLQVGTRTADEHTDLERLGRIGAGRTGVGHKAQALGGSHLLVSAHRSTRPYRNPRHTRPRGTASRPARPGPR